MKKRHAAGPAPGAKPARHAGAPPARHAGAPPAPGPPSPALRAAIPLEPAVPLHRDRWAWASVLAVLPLVIHAWGAPLGEAVAEDFDFLHRVFFSRTHTLLDGGGSSAFWRPLAHQLYYETLGPLILSHPGLVATLHVVLLALASLLLYRALRRVWPGPAAAVVATFPLLSESTRTLISWPSHFVDLGLWLFTAIALHETAARRLGSTLAALLAALLCKEVAVVAALMLPWLPGLGPRGRAQRLRWAAALAAVTAIWAAAYVAIRHRAHLVLPHQLESRPELLKVGLHARLWWAAWNSVRALFSLPAIHVERGGWIFLAALVLVLAALLVVLLRLARGRRARVRAAFGPYLPLAAWGLAWFIAASGTLTPIYPFWAPNRSGFGSLGLGMALAGLGAAAHPYLLGALVALRLVAFALSPGPPPKITGAVPETGAFMDFERLVRLQRLMRDTRVVLEREHPTLPHGAQVGQHYLPRLSEYAFGGSRALQLWYRDTTLQWLRYADFRAHPEYKPVSIAEFQPNRRPQIALVDTDAMRLFLVAFDDVRHARYTDALPKLASADSLQRDRNADVFLGEIAGQRALCYAFLGPPEEVDRWGTRGIALWNENVYARFALGWLEYRRGHLRRSLELLDSVIRYTPEYQAARTLRQRVSQDLRGLRRLESGVR